MPEQSRLHACPAPSLAVVTPFADYMPPCWQRLSKMSLLRGTDRLAEVILYPLTACCRMETPTQLLIAPPTESILLRAKAPAIVHSLRRLKPPVWWSAR